MAAIPAKDEWRYACPARGVQCAMTCGVCRMLGWCADSWDSPCSTPHQGPGHSLALVQARSSWTMYDALEQRHGWKTALPLLCTIAITKKMLESPASLFVSAYRNMQWPLLQRSTFLRPMALLNLLPLLNLAQRLSISIFFQLSVKMGT